jgi:uncharacterized OB-fold protein
MTAADEIELAHRAALEEGRLDHQRCRRCATAWLPPREACPACLADDWEWVTSSGRGRLVSWVVYHVAFDDEWADRVPYHVAVVELDEGPRLITNLVHVVPAHLRIDAPVELVVGRAGGDALAWFNVLPPQR